MYTIIIALIAVFVATHYVWFMLRAFNGIWHELEAATATSLSKSRKRTRSSRWRHDEADQSEAGHLRMRM